VSRLYLSRFTWRCAAAAAKVPKVQLERIRSSAVRSRTGVLLYWRACARPPFWGWEKKEEKKQTVLSPTFLGWKKNLKRKQKENRSQKACLTDRMSSGPLFEFLQKTRNFKDPVICCR
jgi:hypothetical protein